MNTSWLRAMGLPVTCYWSRHHAPPRVRHCSHTYRTQIMGLLNCQGRPDSSVSKVNRLLAGWPMFDSRQWRGIFLFTSASKLALGPTQLPLQWVPGILSAGEKRPRRSADPSPRNSAEVKNAWGYTSTIPYIFMSWCLVKHRNNFIFTVYWTVKKL
jgi:hypothetical protein